MAILLRLQIEGAKPVRQGSDFFWEVLMAKTVNGDAVTFNDIDGACDPRQESSIRSFLKKLITASIVERVDGDPIRYRLLKRSSQCPIVSRDGEASKIGLGRQYMWNVMRRSHGGFTAPDLAIDASTDDVVVTEAAAKKYCQLLKKAGILVLQSRGKPARSHNVYVLRGTANTGPKCPRILTSRIVFDRNTQQIVGDVIAEEERS
ncbi:hypothetical protein [Neorhizobium petrolearium]|uniref:hypothetical protein n=1 Tax=Neorhizobium petrolearium TaxID=515361 RepID=UPI003F81785A